MPEYHIDVSDSPLVDPICGIVPAELPKVEIAESWSGKDILAYLPDYSTLERGVGAIVDGAKGSLCIINGQIDQLPVSDDCKEFLKKELPYIVKDITILAIKGGWYTLTSSSDGGTVFEMDLSSSAMQSIQSAIIKRLGGDYAAELFAHNIGGQLDPTVSAILCESVKIIVGSVILGGANIPYAFGKAIVNKSVSYAYNNQGLWDYAKGGYDAAYNYIYPKPPVNNATESE